MYPLKTAFNKCFETNVCQNNSAKIYSEKILTVYNAVNFQLCIDLMHITPPVTAEGFDGYHHPRYAEWLLTHFHTMTPFDAPGKQAF